MFNPNEVGIKNGNIFGFSCSEEEAEIVIIPVCSDITCSYKKGTANAPEKILEASTQLDFYSPYLEEAWEQKLYLLSIDYNAKDENKVIGTLASKVIKKQERGEGLNKDDCKILEQVNKHSKQQAVSIKQLSTAVLNKKKIPLLLGGDHGVALGNIQAIAEKYTNFGILQIDAHADLRDRYEGFETSHASIMFNALKCTQISKLVQVGVRDVCPDEIAIINGSNGRVKTFFDWDLKSAQYSGKTWQEQCDKVIRELPKKVYVSFDIDGLKPSLCPNTGTPVPGGLEYEQAAYLLNKVVENGCQIIGADLCEVGNNDWDANVGARILYVLTTLITKAVYSL